MRVVVPHPEKEDNMFTKKYNAKVLGKKTYTKKKDDGTEYNYTLYCICYKEEDNKNLEGFAVDTLKSRENLQIGKEYQILIVFQKNGDLYYKEIVGANAI